MYNKFLRRNIYFKFNNLILFNILLLRMRSNNHGRPQNNSNIKYSDKINIVNNNNKKKIINICPYHLMNKVLMLICKY